MFKRIARAMAVYIVATTAIAMLFPGPRHAIAGTFQAVGEFGIRWIASSTPPSNCTLGRDCTYVNSTDDNLYQIKANGSTVNLTTPGVGTTGVFNVMAYGAVGTGSPADDTTAIQSAITAAQAVGGTVYLPPGNFYVTNTLNITGNYVRIMGTGIQSTVVTFNPAAGPKVLFSFANGANSMVQNSIFALRINASAGNVVQKIAIDVVDQSNFVAQDIWVDPNDANFTWSGATSIGIRLRGREAIVLDRIRIWADRPMEFDQCPNAPTTQANDHVHISNTYMKAKSGGGNSIIFISDNSANVVTNLTIDGDNAWLLDKYGLYWSDTTCPTTHYNVNISGLRTEQAVDLTGYSIYIDSSNGIQNVDIHDSYLALGSNGIHINGVTEAAITNVVFTTNDATKKHIEVTSGTKNLRLENDLFQVNTTATLTGMTQLWSMPLIATGAALPSSAWYADSTTAAARPQIISSGESLLVSTFKNTQAANNATKFDTTNTFTGGSEMFGFYNNGTREAYVDSGGNFFSLGGFFETSGATQMHLGTVSATSIELGKSSSGNVFISAPAIVPTTVGTLGASGTPWPSTFTKRIVPNSQNMAFSATPAFDCTAGNYIHNGPVTANVTGPTMVAGSAGEVCTITFLKDATAGTFTINGWGANTRTAGAMTFAATASQLFEITFRWDDRLGTPQWVEQSRVGPI